MRRASLATIILAGGAAIPAATAQSLSESTLRATISQSIEADTNYNLDADSPGTTYFGDTRLGLRFLQDNDTQRLRFALNTGLRALQEPEQDFEWVVASPSTARLAYAQELANNAFDIDVSARSRRIDREFVDEEGFFLDDADLPLPVLPDDVTLVEDNTYEQRYDLNAGFVTGTDAPSSVALRLRASNVDYSGDSPEDFSPRSGAEAELLWRLRLNPVLSSAVFAGYRYEDADNDSETQLNNAEFDLGLIYQPREEVSITLGAGYADRQQRQTQSNGTRTTDNNSGIALRALASYATDDLTFGANLRYTTAAPTSRLSGDLRVSYQQPRSRITARVFQNFGLGSEGDDRRVTGAGLGYSYAINSVSGLGLNLDATSSASADNDTNDGDRSQVDFIAQYRRDITPVVSASLGYGLTQRFDDPNDATSNRVFFQIGRSFVTRF